MFAHFKTDNQVESVLQVQRFGQIMHQIFFPPEE
jgi:hypothetical protein